MIGPSPGAGQVGDRVGGAVLGVGIAVPGDLLPGGGVEEAMTVAGDDHHQVMAVLGVRREADPEKPAYRDAVLVREDGPPGFGCGHHRSGEEPIPQGLLVRGKRLFTNGLLHLVRPLEPLQHLFMISGR